VLQIADPTVDDLEAMRGRAGREIFTFDESSTEAPQRGFARSGRSSRAAADHQDIEQIIA
jgi:hypothetical protein